MEIRSKYWQMICGWKVKLLEFHKIKDVFYSVYFFNIFCYRDIPQSLGADIRPSVATRLILSGRLKPAGDQDLCSAARSSVDPVMNQAAVQWRIQTEGE